jgi:flagellar biosynthesis protein FliQ
MPEEHVIAIGTEMLKTALILSLPVLGFGLLVGLLISVFQALTQINDQTLVFVPKIITVALVLMMFLPWMLRVISEYTEELFLNLNFFAGM